MNVLRDTHRALTRGGLLLDFRPTHPPWARLILGGETVGEIEEPDFPAQVRAAEDGMEAVVRSGLFAPVTGRKRDVAEYYEDAKELIEFWGDCIAPDVQQRVRARAGKVALVYKLVFDLYRAL